MVREWLARLLFWLAGWKVVGERPNIEQYVIIAAPHTSNWDFVISLLLAAYFHLKMKWLGKHTLFTGRFGFFFRAVGGIPVDRRAQHNLVEQVVASFKDTGEIALLITPEGTRKKLPYWKTGFYYIALGAKVPIVLAFADYQRKVGGIGPTVIPTGDIEADMAIFRDFYSSIIGKNPAQFNDIRVRPKDEDGK